MRRYIPAFALLALALPLHAAQGAAYSPEEVVKARCAECHASGKDGAPRIGDRDAWVKRASRGLDTLVASAMRGHGKMPARGGMAELSDAELRGAVNHMVHSSLKPAPK